MSGISSHRAISKSFLFGTSAVAVAAFLSPALAQEGGGGVEIVTVTAQKRAESVQNVPIAVQAFTGDQLLRSGVSSLTEITRLAPNLNVVDQNSLSMHVVIRGVGTNEFFGNAPSSVGTYLDEVTLNSSYMSTLSLFDMERVEVLRGPQNSLFGRNTTGGAINYITRLPTVGDPIEGYALVTYGRHNLMEVEGAVSLPVGTEAAMRISGRVHHRDGLWHNLSDGDDSYGDEDRYALRGAFVWQPTESTRFILNVHHTHDDSDATPQKVTGAMANNPPLRMNDTVPFNTDIDWEHPSLTANLVNVEGLNHTTFRWNDIYNGGGQVANLKQDGAYLKVIHDFNNMTFTSISSYDWTHALYEEDNTGTINGPAGLNHDVLVIDMDQEYKQWTQELRLSSNNNDAPVKWIAGVYYLAENATLAQNIRFGSNGFPGAHPVAAGVLPPGPGDINWLIPNPYINTDSFSVSELRDRSYSAYAQIDWDITEKLGLTAGLRYTKDHKENPHFFAGAFDKTGIPSGTYYDKEFVLSHAIHTPCPFGQGMGPPFLSNCSDDIHREDISTGEWGGKIGLQYHFTPDIMLYGSFSRGFKSGKFDLEFLHTNDTPFPQRSLEPETLDAWEAGFKSVLADHTVIFNAAVFFDTWKDEQVFNVGVNGPEFFNLPESQIYGAEFELTWQPTEHWQVNANIGLLHSELTDVTGIDFDVPQGTPGHGDFQKGHALPLAPDFSATAGVERSFNLGDGLLTLASDFRYQSESFVKYSPQHPIDKYDSRFELNARVDYEWGNERKYVLSVFGTNLTSDKYCAEIQDLRGVSGSYYCVPNDGQVQYGAQLRVNF